MAPTPIPSLPMYFPPAATGFNLTAAQTCASLVKVAYQQYNVWADLGYPSQTDFATNTDWQSGGPSGLQYSTPIWSRFKILDVPFSEPFGFVAWDGSGNVYVVFRGTMTHADDVIDTEIDQTPFTEVSGYGKVHIGFSKVYQGLRTALLAEVNTFSTMSALYFAGHSLGSGISSIAAADIPFNSDAASKSVAFWQYNFASPRAGDPTFAAAMNASAVKTFRIVNTEDLVPDVPPAVSGSISYEHFGYPVDFSAQYRTIVGNHSMADCYFYAITNPDAPLNPSPAPIQNVTTGKGIGTGNLPASVTMPPQPATSATPPPPAR